ncbi:hypothetical protein [Pararhizobium sp. A13]|uniref:hypothetical protein n=1 Tax=Pararhizobium sp. A13 TaxID=3133975 RepID=UPI0032487D9B
MVSSHGRKSRRVKVKVCPDDGRSCSKIPVRRNTDAVRAVRRPVAGDRRPHGDPALLPCAPLRPQELLRGQAEAPRNPLPGEPGFTAWLPLCIADADDDWLDAFITYWYVCRDEYFDRPIYPLQAAPEEPPLCEEWPAADNCSPETLWTDGRR